MTGDRPWTCRRARWLGARRLWPMRRRTARPGDLTVRGLAEKLLHAVTSIDARTARSGWKLLRQPGELTLAWTSGVRKAYVAPFQLS